MTEDDFFCTSLWGGTFCLQISSLSRLFLQVDRRTSVSTTVEGGSAQSILKSLSYSKKLPCSHLPGLKSGVMFPNKALRSACCFFFQSVFAAEAKSTPRRNIWRSIMWRRWRRGDMSRERISHEMSSAQNLHEEIFHKT